jgi:hypothetical protein
MGIARLASILPALMTLGANSAAAAPADPDSRLLARRTVASARVEAIAESDGGRLVRIRRKGVGYAFEYHLEFWRGNGGVVLGATFRHGKCRSGDADLIQPTKDAMAKAMLDFRIGEYLRECPLAAAREAELRRSLDAAWPEFSKLAEEARAATEAESQSIADYGREE